MAAAYTRRYVDDYLDRTMSHLPAFLLTGPRACGKTTTAARRSASVLRLDHPGEASLFRGQPDVYMRRLERPVLIDEWQEVPESMAAIKRAVDAGGGPGQFLVTGSVRARSTSETWPGTGRIIPVPMYSLTQGELLESPEAPLFIERLFAGEVTEGQLPRAPTIFEYIELAAAGGFPEATGLPADLRADWYDGYVSQLVGRDVADLAQIRSPQQLTTLLRTAAINTAGLPTKQSLAEAVRADHRTIDRYLDLLGELGVIQRLPAWGTNRIKRLLKTPKLHLTDSGMALWLAGVDTEGVLRDGDITGRMLDSFVAAQLRPLLRLGRTKVDAYHLRDTDGRREIDLVLESHGGDLVAIEVKAAAAVGPRDARHLSWLRDQVGDSFRAGVVLHTGAMAYSIGDRLWALPIAAIWS